jgi:hypothetical protein
MNGSPHFFAARYNAPNSGVNKICLIYAFGILSADFIFEFGNPSKERVNAKFNQVFGFGVGRGMWAGQGPWAEWISSAPPETG